MQLNHCYVRGTRVGPVSQADLHALATVLTHQPVELLLTAQGAVMPASAPGRPRQRIQDGMPAAIGLAKRNIRSLLCLSRESDEVADALAAALTEPPRAAEDALEEAGLELNLRYSLYASPDASISVQERCLMVTDGSSPTVRIARRNLRQEAAPFFAPQAIARLVMLDVDEICFAPGAIHPVWMQLEPGAVMAPDSAQQHLRKGGWRAVRKPDFIKGFCVACGRCFVHCPENAVIHAPYDKFARETTGILGIDLDRCTACGLCAAVCPTNRAGYKAIVLTEADAESSPDLHCVG